MVATATTNVESREIIRMFELFDDSYFEDSVEFARDVRGEYRSNPVKRAEPVTKENTMLRREKHESRGELRRRFIREAEIDIAQGSRNSNLGSQKHRVPLHLPWIKTQHAES